MLRQLALSFAGLLIGSLGWVFERDVGHRGGDHRRLLRQQNACVDPCPVRSANGFAVRIAKVVRRLQCEQTMIVCLHAVCYCCRQ